LWFHLFYVFFELASIVMESLIWSLPINNKSTRLRNIILWKNLGVTFPINLSNQLVDHCFLHFFALSGCKNFFVFQTVNLIVLLKIKGYILKILLKRIKEFLFFGISALKLFRMICSDNNY
jgi:hypothetical protein